MPEMIKPDEKASLFETSNSALSPSKIPAEELKSKKHTIMDAEQFIDKDHSDSNMLVAIRLRPLASKEISNEDFEIISIEDKLLV